MPQTWTAVSGSPGGPYVNRFVSQKLYEASFEEAEVIKWVEPVEGFGKKKGDTVNLYTMTGPDESGTGILSENIRIPETSVSIAGTSFTIKEFGTGVTWSNIYDDWAAYDLPPVIQKRLKMQMKLTLDYNAGIAARLAKIAFIPTGAASVTVDTDGTPSTAAAAAVGVTHLQLARDYLYGTLKAPYFGGGDSYVGLFNWSATRSIRNDPLFKEWYVLGHPEKLQRGEIGVIENIRVIETNHDTVLETLTTGGVSIGQGLILADEGIAFAEAQTPELRLRIADDYGRNLGCAWYGQVGFGIYHDVATARRARIIRFTGSNFTLP
jgi:N4-gp56 family major capsid protein